MTKPPWKAWKITHTAKPQNHFEAWITALTNHGKAISRPFPHFDNAVAAHHKMGGFGLVVIYHPFHRTTTIKKQSFLCLPKVKHNPVCM